MITDKNIGNEIHRLAIDRGVRVKDLMKQAGMPPSLISIWKKQEPNSVLKIRHILKTLDEMTAGNK